jgi:predicted metal-dependent hydrolase
MPQKIILDNRSFDIIHKTNKKIKRVSLTLENQDEIIIKTPLGFKQHLIKEFIYEYQDWILKAIQKVPQKNQIDFLNGGLIPFLGQNYQIKAQKDQKLKNPKLIFNQDYFILLYNENNINNKLFYEALKKFYKTKSKQIICPIFDKLIKQTNLHPNKISYRFAKTRWGSCSSINNISINYTLLQFNIEAIEYVVLHELCHIAQKNHSKRFWNLVSSYMPNYKSISNKIHNKLFL